MTDETKVEATTSSRGAQWTTAGGVLALAAKALTGDGGLLGNLTGNGGAANAAVLAIAQKDSEIALLKAKVETREEVSQVYAALRAKLRKILEGLAVGGMIDTNALRECVKNGFDLAGSVLLDERLPLRFTQEDADKFFATL